MKAHGPLVPQRAILIIILAVSVITRLAAALYLGNTVEPMPGTFDQVSYHALALRLLSGHGFSFAESWWPLTAAGAPTAHWSYLYTGFLTSVYSLFGPNPIVARLIQAVIVGILHPYLAYRLGRLVFGAAAGLVAAALTVVYIYFVYYTATLMTEPLYITAIMATLYLIIRITRAGADWSWRSGLLLGLTLAVAVLLRQLFLLIIPLLFLWLWLVSYLEKRQVPLLATIFAGLVVIAMILPFTLYNYARFDRFVLLNTNAGYAFFWANHPIYGTQFEPILPPEMGSYQELIPRDLRHLDEAALDRALLERGIEFVMEDPGRYALLSLSRVPAYFTFWPSAESSTISNLSRVLSFGLLWPFMVGGLLPVFRRQKIRAIFIHPAFLLVLFAASYSAIHILSWSLIRYRLPVDAVMLVFAAVAIVEIARWLTDNDLLPARLGAAQS